MTQLKQLVQSKSFEEMVRKEETRFGGIQHRQTDRGQQSVKTNRQKNHRDFFLKKKNKRWLTAQNFTSAQIKLGQTQCFNVQ